MTRPRGGRPPAVSLLAIGGLAAAVATVLALSSGPHAQRADAAKLAGDDFSRSAARAWGPAASGGRWSHVAGAPARPAVVRGKGRLLAVARPSGSIAHLPRARGRDVDARVDVLLPRLRGAVQAELVLRRQRAGPHLRVGLTASPSGRLVLHGRTSPGRRLFRPVVLRTRVRPRAAYRIRARVEGAAPTRVRASAWRVGTRPPRWLVDARTRTGPRAAGTIGLRAHAGRAGRGTLVAFDNLHAVTLPVRRAPAPPPATLAAHEAAVTPYGLTPGATPSSSYSVTVDAGQGPVPVPVEAVPGNLAHARWAMDRPVTVRVTAPHAIAAHRLSPAAAGLSESVAGRQIAFRVDRPRKMVLHGVNGVAERLVLVAEPPETGAPDRARGDVRDAVAESGADPTGAADARPLLQAALAAPGTSAVVVPRGRYRLGGSAPLVIPPGRRLHLDPEALLFADPGVPDRAGGSLIQAGAGSQITGRGIIDGSGTAIRPAMTLDWVMVRTPDGAAGLTVRDVMIRNCPKGSMSLNEAPGFHVTNVKLVNGLDAIGAANGDGLAPQNGSSDGLLDDSLLIGSDDPIGLGYRSPTASVTLSNLVLGNLASGAALKGVLHADHPDDGLNRDTVLENVDVIAAPRVISYIPQHPGTFADHYFKNVRAEGEAGDGLAIQLDLSIWDPASTGAARIERFVFSGIHLPGGAGHRSIVRGADDAHRVSGVLFEDLRIGGVQAGSLSEGRVDLGDHASDVALSGVVRPQVSVDAGRPLVGAGEATHFRISRTGPTGAPLRVRYRLEGEAAGPREVDVPAGAGHVDVPVALSPGATHALLVLQSSGPNLDYLVGPRYLAMVGSSADDAG